MNTYLRNASNLTLEYLNDHFNKKNGKFLLNKVKIISPLSDNTK